MAKVRVPQVRTLLFNNEDIGMGFNSDTNLAVGTALDFDTPTKEPGQQAQASAEIVTTHEALMETLNLSSEAQGRYGFASASGKVKFSRNTSYNSVSTFVVAKMVVNNQITRGRNFRIKPQAAQVLATQPDLADSRFRSYSPRTFCTFTWASRPGGQRSPHFTVSRNRPVARAG